MSIKLSNCGDDNLYFENENRFLQVTLEDAIKGGVQPEKLDEILQKAIEHADHCNEHLSKFTITEEFYSEEN